MLIWILIAILITPWFRNLTLPPQLPSLNFAQDRQNVRMLVEWERGKIKPSYINALFSNWPEEMFHQRMGIVMENLDIGNYFFSGHPRERVGVIEKEKFTLLQLVLFIIGLTHEKLKRYKKFLLGYTGLALILVFLFKLRTFEETVFLSIPFILIIALGMDKCFSWVKLSSKKVKKQHD